jgi:hypothetical protein
VETVGSALVYLGLLTALAGAVNVFRPLRRLGVHRRRAGAALLAAGALIILVAAALPARTAHAGAVATRLDAFLPAWQFQELHTIRIHAPLARVDRAVREVTADEIWLFRTLTWIRHPPLPWRRRAAHILAAPGDQPILDVALRTTFLRLADEPRRELVVGTIVCCRPSGVRDAEAFVSLDQPGFAKAGMNFLMSDEGGGWTRLSTETRVHGTDAHARRRFAAYWRAIYPGSALIRVMWLRAIKARAEREDV